MKDQALNWKKAKLSIIVPVFNEATELVRHIDLLLAEVEGYFQHLEVIVVSDGSTDSTNSQLISMRHPDLHPILVEKNTGKGNAVRAGFHQASGDYLLFIDGGMEIHPREIRIFVGLMELYRADIVIGSKRHPQSKVIYPWYRKLLSWMFQLFTRALFQVNVTDSQVGIKLFRREVVDAILPYLEINRYGFDLEMLILARKCGFDQVLEAPIRLDYFSGSRRLAVADLWHVLHVGLSLLKDTLKLYFRLKHLKIEKPTPERLSA